MGHVGKDGMAEVWYVYATSSKVAPRLAVGSYSETMLRYDVSDEKPTMMPSPTARRSCCWFHPRFCKSLEIRRLLGVRPWRSRIDSR